MCRAATAAAACAPAHARCTAAARQVLPAHQRVCHVDPLAAAAPTAAHQMPAQLQKHRTHTRQHQTGRASASAQWTHRMRTVACHTDTAVAIGPHSNRHKHAVLHSSTVRLVCLAQQEKNLLAADSALGQHNNQARTLPWRDGRTHPAMLCASAAAVPCHPGCALTCRSTWEQQEQQQRQHNQQTDAIRFGVLPPPRGVPFWVSRPQAGPVDVCHRI